MKLKFLFCALAAAMIPAMAHAEESSDDNGAHWFLQGGLGASYSVGGGAGFGEMLSPAGQVAFGRTFNPYVGVRVTAGGWRGRYHIPQSTCKGFYDYHFTGDFLWNIIETFNHDFTGKVSPRLIAGAGFDRAFANPSSSLLVRLGLAMDVHLCKAIDFNLEYQANGVSDRWNSKNDHSFDCFMNVLVGATYKFGTGYKCTSCVPEPCAQPEIELVQKTNAMIEAEPQVVVVHDTIEVVKEVPVPVVENISRTVFYAINQVQVPVEQEPHVAEIAQYLKQYPNATATVTGYADKGTGTNAINVRLAKERADNVATMLTHHFGIDPARLDVSSMLNDNNQPYKQNDLNRVVIMTANYKK
ncbi:MAG: OmpA family protein [Muribaculaceae bacterium]|nr:OmpA family protein [Muribaculaceae bacterium]